MRDVESQDPDRHLIGFDDRLKGRDRIKEKVCGTIKDFDRSPEEAVVSVSLTLFATPFSTRRTTTHRVSEQTSSG